MDVLPPPLSLFISLFLSPFACASAEGTAQNVPFVGKGENRWGKHIFLSQCTHSHKPNQLILSRFLWTLLQ